MVVVFLLCCPFTAVRAEERAFQLSLTPDIAIHPESTVIKGFALNLWGENQQRAIALGFVNGSKGSSYGFSFGFLLNYADNYQGAQVAPVNYTAGTHKGLQLGIINYAETMGNGLQVGFVNIIRNNKIWFSEFPDQIAPAMVIVNWRF
jgi:hypothetical protein